MLWVHLVSVAVPGVLVGDKAPSSFTDRCHSLSSLDSATGGGRVAPQNDRGGKRILRRIASHMFKRDTPGGCPLQYITRFLRFLQPGSLLYLYMLPGE